MDGQRDVLIIGGGVIGLTTAYFLARDGMQVSVVDTGNLGREASWAGAGIISPGNSDRATGAMNLLRAHSCRLFPILSEELRQSTGQENGYRACGGVELASGIDDATVAEWDAEGIEYRNLPARELKRLESAFAHVHEDGYFLPTMAQVRNPWHLRALIAACQNLGVELLPNTPIRQLECRHLRRIEGARSNSATLRADRFLVAAGPWTDSLLKPLGWRPGVFPVRGQMVLFRAELPLFTPILLQGKRYLVPRTDGRILAGSTEEDVGYVKSTTEEGVGMLTDMARTLVPALREVPIETTWSGLRPATHDGLPYLGRVPGMDNLFVASGHFRAGIQNSPATGLIMSQLLQSRETLIPLDEFALDGGR